MEQYWKIVVAALLVLNIYSAATSTNVVNADPVKDPVPFPCGYNYMSEAKAWFKYHTLEVLWEEAVVICESEGAKLASPGSDVIQKYMEYLMNIQNSSVIHIRWGSGNPIRYSYGPGTNKCYKLHRNHNTWDSARDSCLAEYGHLAIINDETEAQVIKEIFARHPSDPVTSTELESTAHVGFHAYDGNWTTVLGGSLEEIQDKNGYRIWYTGEPNGARSNEHCGAVGRNGKVYDVSCNKQYYYICEKKAESCHEFKSIRLCLCPLDAMK